MHKKRRSQIIQETLQVRGDPVQKHRKRRRPRDAREMWQQPRIRVPDRIPRNQTGLDYFDYRVLCTRNWKHSVHAARYSWKRNQM